VLDQQVAPGHAEVGGPVLHVGRDVGGAHDDHAHARIARGEDELAGDLRILGRNDARRREQRLRLLVDPSLRQRDGDHGVAFS